MATSGTSLSVQFRSNVNRTVAGSGVTTFAQHQIDRALSWDNGVLANQADLVWQTTNTLATGATTSHDLSGSLTDATGATTVFVRFKAIVFYSDGSNTTNLTLFNDAAGIVGGLLAANTNAVTVRPGGLFAVGCTDVTGYTVTNTTADLLKVTNAAGASATYTLIVVGCSA